MSQYENPHVQQAAWTGGSITTASSVEHGGTYYSGIAVKGSGVHFRISEVNKKETDVNFDLYEPKQHSKHSAVRARLIFSTIERKARFRFRRIA